MLCASLFRLANWITATPQDSCIFPFSIIFSLIDNESKAQENQAFTQGGHRYGALGLGFQPRSARLQPRSFLHVLGLFRSNEAFKWGCMVLGIGKASSTHKYLVECLSFVQAEERVKWFLRMFLAHFLCMLVSGKKTSPLLSLDQCSS